MRRPKKRICKRCGEEFAPRIHNQVYCSNSCGRYQRRSEVKEVHEHSVAPKIQSAKEEPWDVRSVTEMLKQKLVVGKSYLLELKELEPDGRIKTVLRRVKLVGKYDHHAQFENARGIRTHLSFRWWELKGLLKGGY